MLSQRGVGPGKVRHGRADGSGGVQPGPLGMGRRVAVAAAQPDRPCQLTDKEVHLLPGLGGTGRVVEVLRLFQLGPQLIQPRLVGRLGRCVQQLPRVAEVGTHLQRITVGPALRRRWRRLLPLAVGRLQIDRMELPSGMGQQPGQVAQALGVLDVDHRALIGDGPVLPLLAEHVPPGLGNRCRSGRLRRRCPTGLNRSQRLDPLGNGSDPQGASRGKRSVQEPHRPAAVGGPAPAQQHPRVLVTGAGQEGPGAQLIVGAERRLVVGVGLLPSGRQGRQQPEVERRGPQEQDRVRHEDGDVVGCVGKQDRVQALGGIRVVEARGQQRGEGQGRQPEAIARPRRKPLD